jgi:hypothetical protein
MGFGLVNGFIDHFTTQLGIASNYSAIVHLHTLEITASSTETSPACSVFTSHFLVMAFNSEDSSASVLTPFPAGHHPTTQLSSKLVPLITLHHRPHRKHSSSVVACMFTALLGSNGCGVDYRKQSSSIVAGVTSSGRCLHSHHLTMGLYATVCSSAKSGQDRDRKKEATTAVSEI